MPRDAGEIVDISCLHHEIRFACLINGDRAAKASSTSPARRCAMHVQAGPQRRHQTEMYEKTRLPQGLGAEVQRRVNGRYLCATRGSMTLITSGTQSPCHLIRKISETYICSSIRQHPDPTTSSAPLGWAR